MACALLVLSCAAVASASRYADYSGVKMPQYGADYDTHDAPGPIAAAEDYQGRSPDAPAALDYKYEEESNGKTATLFNEIADADPWQPSRKYRGSLRAVGNDNLDDLDKYNSNDNMAPKLKSRHHISKRRPRLKSRSQMRSDELSRRPRFGRNKVDVSDRNDYLLDKDEFSDDKSKDFDNDVRLYNRRVTERIIRRKVRDRFVKSRVDNDILEDDDLLSNKKIEDDSIELDDLTGIDSRRRRPNDKQIIQEQMRPTNDDSIEITSRPRMDIKSKVNEEYNDYYDMKRVQNLKKKIPELLRRASTRMAATTRTATSTQLLLWNNRRTLGTGVLRLANITKRTTEIKATRTMPSTYKSTTSTTTEVQTTQSSTELSLAEKSRLSILKKSQKKDNLNNEFSTNKPPVLLQVMKQLPTVVIVEPPTSQNPWIGARLVSDDSPARLDKVKSLMRHKLVAGARNIQDLTSNWDDMVCDYIDTSLLEDSASRLSISLVLISIIINLNIFVF